MPLPSSVEVRIDGIVRAARKWREPEHESRRNAVQQALAASGRATEEAVAFAINQQMEQLTAQTLRDWVGGRASELSRRVGVLDARQVPLGGLRDWLAVTLAGHDYVGSVQPVMPHLLMAFADEVARQADGGSHFAEPDEVVQQAEVLLVAGNDEQREWAVEQAEAHGIPPARRLVRPERHAVAVVDGNESEDEREGLAEDVLLHEGLGPWSASIIWAPRGLSPDVYLESMAHFRSVFPTHADTPGALQMQRAFLEARDQPHAYGEGLEFLVSKGDPEVQSPGHVRWSEYDDLGEVADWLRHRVASVQAVTARLGIELDVPDLVPRVALGDAHRPRLSAQGERDDVLGFLTLL